MHPYKRQPSPLFHPRSDENSQPIHAHVDLLLRALSAIGMLALGIAGWRFQVTTQRSREVTEQRDRDSRKCLPVVRSLTDLEFALDDAAAILAEQTQVTGGADQRSLFPELAQRIDSAAILTSLMDEDPQMYVDLPDVSSTPARSRRVQLGIRAAAFMFADLLRVVSLAAKAGDPPFTSVVLSQAQATSREHDKWRVMIYSGKIPMYYMFIRTESLPAWRAWLTDKREYRVSVEAVLRSSHAQALALREQVALETQSVIRANSQFGEQFVIIQSDAMKTRRPIVLNRAAVAEGKRQ